MPAPTLIELTDEQRNEYQCLCRSGMTEVRLKLRLSIVLLADEGLANTEIAESLSISAPTVSRWRNRFSTDGLKGIRKDLPRGWTKNGAGHTRYGLLRQKIIEKTTREKPKDATHWSTRSLAKELGIQSTFVSRVWRECG